MVVGLGAGSLTAFRLRSWAPVIHPVALGGPECRAVLGGSIKGSAVLWERGHDKHRARPSVRIAPWSWAQALLLLSARRVHAASASFTFALARLRRARQRISPSRSP